METTTLEKAVATGGPVAQEIVKQIVHAFETEANVKAVFGEPVKLDGHSVIPVAAVFVSIGGGAGLGGGFGKAVQGAVELAQRFLPRGLAGGGGGGINLWVRPVGFIHDDKDAVTFTPIFTTHPAH